VVVAALRDRAGDVKFLARYSNCPLSSHAEESAPSVLEAAATKLQQVADTQVFTIRSA
jgi:hypothetical protein